MYYDNDRYMIKKLVKKYILKKHDKIYINDNTPSHQVLMTPQRQVLMILKSHSLALLPQCQALISPSPIHEKHRTNSYHPFMRHSTHLSHIYTHKCIGLRRITKNEYLFENQ